MADTVNTAQEARAAGATHVWCPRCKTKVLVEEADNGTGTLRCENCENESLGSAHGGFIPLKRPSARTNPEGRYEARHWLARGEGYELSDKEFRLVHALMSHEDGNENDESWPGIETLARETQSSERTVKRTLAGLLERGLVKQWRPRRRGPNHYSVADLRDGRVIEVVARDRPNQVTRGAKTSILDRPCMAPLKLNQRTARRTKERQEEPLTAKRR